MNHKIILAALAVTFVAGVAAHADEYRRPRQSAPQPQQEEAFDDEDLDEEYYRPSRHQRPPPRRGYDCHPSGCQPPEVLPYNAPAYAHPPLAHQVHRICTVVPGIYGGRRGWVVVLNNQISIEGGFYDDVQRLPHVRQNLLRFGTCQVFSN